MMHLKVGDKAPELNVKDQDGITHSLADYKGKKIVLYFYPKDATPGCTAQACNLRDNHNLLKKAGYNIIGVSADNENSHIKFIEKQNLNFPLLADTDKELIKRYGVWGEKKFMGKTYDGIHRTTFVIDENGIIENIITKVKTKDHAAQVLSA
ncbi:MAG: thioredoxin-dependent thiol peroxidase [Vicingaceae bacterium]|jgi:peroxiredoxin Q/BCP|nr:thioredoxin-dependent thiol peroxidase [Flavobacteriales bacterium]MDF1675364.1 thioredoxin-dependent thiol peroxidase [Vicingaceae bacterium]